MPLAVVFKAAFPTVTYHSVHAKQRLLQLLLAVIHIVKDRQKHQSELYLMEKIVGLEYGKLAGFLSRNFEVLSRKKQELKQLFEVTSNREKELIRYAVYKASGATSIEAVESLAQTQD